MHRLKIAISAGFSHPDPARAIFIGKTLLYVEQSIAHWVMSQGALPVMVPTPAGNTHHVGQRHEISFSDYAQWLDGLVLMGGADLWPGSYGEHPLQPQWQGDRIRDDYERALTQAFVEAGKPVFGVCRGLQMLNVAFGGTLLQDIATQRPEALTHRDASIYDQNFHDIEFVPGTRLAQLYPGQTRVTTNSIHHQAIKDLAAGFTVEARCPDDGMIEALRWQGPSYVAAVQWHPEFHNPEDRQLIDDAPILRDFLDAARTASQR